MSRACGNKRTASFLQKHGIKVETIKKIFEGSPNVVDLMRSGEVKLLINTPTSKLRASADAIKAIKSDRMTICSIQGYLRINY